MTTEKTTAVQKKEGAGLPALAASFEDHANEGMEGLGMEDVARPGLVLLQSNSPQATKGHAKYIKGATSGNIMKTDTGEVFDGEAGVRFVPCGYDRQFIEWRPRETGGGYVQSVPANDPLVGQINYDDKNKPVLPNGNHLIDTRDHFGLLVKDDGSYTPVIISMSSTNVKVSKQFNSSVQSVKMPSAKTPGAFYTPPVFANVYRMTAVLETNDYGSWYRWTFQHEGFVEDAGLFAAAKEFTERVREGAVKVDRTVDVAASDADTEEGPF